MLSKNVLGFMDQNPDTFSKGQRIPERYVDVAATVLVDCEGSYLLTFVELQLRKKNCKVGEFMESPKTLRLHTVESIERHYLLLLLI